MVNIWPFKKKNKWVTPKNIETKGDIIVEGIPQNGQYQTFKGRDPNGDPYAIVRDFHNGTATTINGQKGSIKPNKDGSIGFKITEGSLHVTDLDREPIVVNEIMNKGKSVKQKKKGK